MSKDRLEEFIKDNREDFDSEIPSLNIFADIEKELKSEPKQKKSRQLATRSAAAIIVLAIVCAWFLIGNGSSKEVKMNESPIAMTVKSAHSELAEASEYYTQKINNSKGKLIALNHLDPDLYRDLNHMEAMYDTLMMEWNRNSHKSDEKLIDAMITNYRNRSMLLENVVNRVEGRNYSFVSARPAVYKR